MKHPVADVTERHKPHIMAIHLHKGCKAHYIDNDAHGHDNQHEGEVLVHRGTRYKIHHTEETDHHLVTHVTVHSQRD